MSDRRPEPVDRRTLTGYFTKLLSAAMLIVLLYPLSLAPVFKLCWAHPTLAAIVPVQVIYHPLIKYLSHHRFDTVDNLSYWYATKVWGLPMVRQ